MPVVTGVRERPRGRVEVDLDGAVWRLLPVDVVARAGLVVGRTLDRETARALARELRSAAALERTSRALRQRDRSREALAERLAGAGVPAAAAESALAKLEAAGLVDDARLATRRAEALAERGYGDAAIRFGLARELLPAALVEEALRRLQPEPERARTLVERRGAGPRTARWLAARGFDPATVSAAVGFADEA